MGLEAIISGGGIGGLGTAAALARRGWKVTVFESAAQMRDAGSGIYMQNNGLAVLTEIGAHDRALEGAFQGLGMEERGYDGRVVLPPSLPPGRKLVSIPRRNLQAALLEAAEAAGVKIVMSATVVDALAEGTLLFANGTKAQADLAIGCDGIWSPVRRALGLEHFHQRIDDWCHRTIVRATQDDMPPEARQRCIECWNGTRRLLVTPINDSEVYLALVALESDVEAHDPRVGPWWNDTFPQWAWLFDRMEPSKVTWNQFSLIKCKRWSAGRTCILGDAAHAQPPTIGQGAGMALTNGMALAAYMEHVSDPRDIPEALAAWEDAMRPLTEVCQRWSMQMLELRHMPDELRNDFLRTVFTSPWVLSNIDAATDTPAIIHTDWRPRATSTADARDAGIAAE